MSNSFGSGLGPFLGLGAGAKNQSSGFRITKTAFVVSNSVLYGIVILAFALRLYVRIGIQRHVYADDAFIALGVILLTASVGAFYKYWEDGFAEEELIDGNFSVLAGSDLLTNGLTVRKWLTAATIMLWTTINCAKFSFLFLFYRLILRLRFMKIYWWLALAYVTAVWGWGISSFIVPCPNLNSLFDALQCISGPKADLAVNYVFAQVALDIFGDLLILAIPIRLIWQVQIRWTQKMALMSSLCLSVALVVVSVVRATGVLRKGILDSLWIIYWFFTAAEIGMILSCAAAFRTIFVAQQARRQEQRNRVGINGDIAAELPSRSSRFSGVIGRVVHLFGRLFDHTSFSHETNSSGSSAAASWPRHRKRKQHLSADSAATDTSSSRVPELEELPRPPPAALTGLGTFIRRYGRESYLSTSDRSMISGSGDEERGVLLLRR